MSEASAQFQRRCKTCDHQIPGWRSSSSYCSSQCRVKASGRKSGAHTGAQVAHPISLLSPSERSALRVLHRAGAVNEWTARAPAQIPGATVTALRSLGRHSFVDWRSMHGELHFWLTESGLALAEQQRAAA